MHYSNFRHKENIFAELLTKVRKMVGKYSKSENAHAQCKVIRKCEWKDDLQLTREDFNILGKFLAGFKLIKRMSDQLNGIGWEQNCGPRPSLPLRALNQDDNGLPGPGRHHQHKALHNILQAVYRPGQVLLLWLVLIGRILKIYQPLQIMSDTEPTCDREELDRELVTLTVKLLKLARDFLKVEVQKLDSQEAAMNTVENQHEDEEVRDFDDEEEDIPGGGLLDNLNTRDLRRLGQENELDKRCDCC